MPEADKVFNLVEGLVWLVIGVILLWSSRSRRRTRAPSIGAGIAYILFGVTDFIEIRTRTWYSPAWLLIWNVVCVVALVGCLIWYLAVRPRPGPVPDEPPGRAGSRGPDGGPDSGPAEPAA